MGELARPWGVAVSKDGSVMVTEWECGCVVVLNRRGNVTRLFGGKGNWKGKFYGQRGIASSDDNIFVIDSWNHCIQKFDLGGNFFAAVGNKRK